MSDSRVIEPIGPFEATLRPPGSKSITNRALLLAALARGKSRLTSLLFSDDSRAMLEALQQLGVRLEIDEAGESVVVHGTGSLTHALVSHTRAAHEPLTLPLGNAGTAMRFLTAACAATPGLHCVLDGIARMRQRPIAQLVEPLRQLGGAEITYQGQDGYPPLLIKGNRLQGGRLSMQPTLSSQYISALLHIGPLMKHGLDLRFQGPVTSKPYVAMTLAVMAAFGVVAEVDEAFTHIVIPPVTQAGAYRGRDYAIEPDASNASYFLAAGAVVPGGGCTIEGLGRGSLQGDVGFADVLHQMGAGLTFGRDFITVMAPRGGEKLRGIDIDLNAMPDTAQTLAAIAPLCDGPTIIRNVGNLRVKETNRLTALQCELTKLGVEARIKGDDLFITPPPQNRLTPAAIDTYDDHRMAMSFAVLGLATPPGTITINDPACVNKTFPRFFEYLEGLASNRSKGR